jgi:DNA-directed RNA polymerase I, II, and III subunit RPABC1
MDELTYLRNAWNTCIEMVSDRGYSIQDEYKDLTESDFKYLIQENKLDIYGVKKNESNVVVEGEEDPAQVECIFVKFILARRIKPTAIKACIDEIRSLYSQTKSMEIVLVLKIEPNHSIYKIEKEKSERDNTIQIMHCKQLQMNVTKHFLVPNHLRISEEEANELLKTYNLVSRQQLPLLLRDDPVARYYNYKSGDVVCITNNSISMNYGYRYYRCVR